jgi:hypothetical protein
MFFLAEQCSTESSLWDGYPTLAIFQDYFKNLNFVCCRKLGEPLLPSPSWKKDGKQALFLAP